MKKLLISAILIVSIATTVLAAAGGNAGLDFLRLGGGARPQALGEAYTGLANDASAMYYNPAGLAQMQFPEVMTESDQWFADINHVVVGAAVPASFGVVGVGYSGVNSGDIQGYDMNGAVTSVFNTSSSAINVSLGRPVNANLAWGAGIKSVSEKLEGSNGSTLAFDAGLQYRPNRNISLGAALLNVGSGITFISDSTALPSSLRLGGSYSGALFSEDVNLDADMAFFADGPKLDLGLEYIIKDMLALRVGTSGGYLHSGIGIVSNLLAVDFAYLQREDLGQAYQLSLSLLFGAQERSKKMALERLALGNAYLSQGKYSDAVLMFNSVLDLDPTNEDAALLLKRAQLELERQALEQVFTEKEGQQKRTVDEILTSGRVFLDQEKYIEALAEFSKALKVEPTNRLALQLQSDAQTRMENKLIQESKDEAKNYLGEAMKLVVTGKYNEALSQVELALAKDPKNSEALTLQKKLKLIIEINKKQ